MSKWSIDVTKAPDKLWAWPEVCLPSGAWYHSGEWLDRELQRPMVEYVRRDLVHSLKSDHDK